ncbi:MAG: NADPH-dependent 7-cyano-7-deazaguanine reductase QueF [Pseudomonadales bacterium]|nr:NADPH-dependent 7-cyano-7-deazaguanine reductase QueF [Pseudomonadales bacterium]
MTDQVNDSPLGKETPYPESYDAALLCPIERAQGRKAVGIKVGDDLPFKGVDYWNAYEISWLNSKGKPCVGVLELVVPCDSDCIVESKSLKLYFNSLNQNRFESVAQLVSTIESDLEKVISKPVEVRLHSDVDNETSFAVSTLKGECVDHLDISVDDYEFDDTALALEPTATFVSETLISHLLRSNCPVTSQPDWASVLIRYKGNKIDRESLLKYLISYRTHNEFHEQCVERIFMDIKRQCGPTELTVYARYTRRGGIDINPFRSDFELPYPNARLLRQ